MTVKDGTTGRVFNLLEKGIRVSTFLVVIARNLKHEKTNDVDDHDQDSYTTNHIMPIFKIGILHLERTLSIARIRSDVSTPLASV